MLNPQDRLFRRKSLERLASPEQVDELMQLTPPGLWLASLAILIIMVAGVTWGLLGRVPTLVRGEGILVRGALQTVEATAAGRVVRMIPQVDQDVEEGDVVAYLQTAQGTTVVVTSPGSGRALTVHTAAGSVVLAGAPLVTLERVNAPLEAMVYLPSLEGKHVRPGMVVQLAPASVRKEEHGLLIGEVTSVGAFPVTAVEIRRQLGSDDLARALTTGGPRIQVHVALNRDASTRSGYQWTSTLPATLFSMAGVAETGRGPDVELGSGTMTLADVIVDEEPPVNLVIKGVAR